MSADHPHRDPCNRMSFFPIRPGQTGYTPVWHPDHHYKSDGLVPRLQGNESCPFRNFHVQTTNLSLILLDYHDILSLSSGADSSLPSMLESDRPPWKQAYWEGMNTEERRRKSRQPSEMHYERFVTGTNNDICFFT